MPSLPELDYGRADLPASVHYVGHGVWHPPEAPGSADWLDALPAASPWVHVTEGTSHYQDPFVLRAAATGLAGRPLEAILTTGQQRDPDALGLGPLAPNVHLTDWLSHGELLPRCQVVVTTGGPATIMAALRAGVPLVIVPTTWDKPDNARRVTEAGVGVRLAPRRCTPERLRAAVEEVLARPALARPRPADRRPACPRARPRRRRGAARDPRPRPDPGDLRCAFVPRVRSCSPCSSSPHPACSPHRRARRASPAIDPSIAQGFGNRGQQLLVVDGLVQGQAVRGHGAQPALRRGRDGRLLLPAASTRSPPEGFPEVDCPRDRYDMDLRAEIWQLDPVHGRLDAGVPLARGHPQPARAGKFVARDIGFREHESCIASGTARRRCTSRA